MLKFWKTTLAILLWGAILMSAVISASANGNPLHASVMVNPASSPIPVKAEGKINLVYEIMISNLGSTPLILTDIEAFSDVDCKNMLVFYDSNCFPQMLKSFERKSKEGDNINPGFLDCGKTIAAFIWVQVEDMESIPHEIHHRLHFTGEGSEADSRAVIKAQPMTVDPTQKPVVIKSPVMGDGWLAAEGPVNIKDYSHHRFGIIAMNGRPWIAQRYAVDWIKFGDDGKLYKDDPNINENYYCYGENLHAVADGTVVEAKDGIPENIPLAKEMAVPITMETLCGNYVFLDIGGGYYALYAHMIPGSLRVKAGDRVKAGQVLGQLGNSGNSTGPHLHFHISKKPEGNLLASEGVPFVMESYYYRGLLPIPIETDDEEIGIDDMTWNTEPVKQEINNEMPLGYYIYSFE